MEEFKICVESYEISNFGNVRKKLKNGIYKAIGCSINNKGYKYFQLQRNNRRINYLVHHLVAKHFLGERPDNKVIDHIDINPLNNNASNLRYVTQKENVYNHPRIIKDIKETEPKARHKIVQQIYCEKNKDLIKQKKKEYYNKNKENILRYYKTKHIVKCSKCNEEREISKSQYLKIKNSENNHCKKCQSKINLGLNI